MNSHERRILRPKKGVGMTGKKACFVCLICFLIVFSQTLASAAGLTIAMLKSEGNYPMEEFLAGFNREMSQNNISYQMVPLDASPAPEQISNQIIRVKPDILLCIGLRALEKAAPIQKIPKLFVMVTSENAKVWSGRNDIFGVTLDIAPALQFRIMRQAMPACKKIGVLYDPDQNQKLIEEARKAAAAAGFSLVAHPIRSIREIPLALQKMENNIDVIWTIYDQTAYTPESTQYVLMQTLRNKIPMVGLSAHFARAGALLAIYGDYMDMGQQTAALAATLAQKEDFVPRISRPHKVHIAINKKVGRVMEINFPEPFLRTVHQTY